MEAEDETLEHEIEELFEQGVRAYSKMGAAGREPGFHVSGLSYECLRSIQYARLHEEKETSNHEEGEEMDKEGLWRTWIGTKLHETPITDEHEFGLSRELDVNGTKVKILGHIDEVKKWDDGTRVIIDKKFVATVPRSPNAHHIKQVSYYAALYNEQTGANVDKGALLYFRPVIPTKRQLEEAIARGEPILRMRAFAFDVDAKAAKAELEEKVRKVQEAINAGKIIDRTTGWLCGYCKWKKDCEALSGPVTGPQKQIEEKKE
jgi:CRISPR/Cas system-associated exonuclease Cas4 (RecB family)